MYFKIYDYFRTNNNNYLDKRDHLTEVKNFERALNLIKDVRVFMYL